MYLVSIIIPAYNAGKYIRQTIESSLNQTFQNFEVIVIDDGSTDNTAEVVNAIKDSRIRYIYQKNASQAVARNTGITSAKGDLIAFLDADDLWIKDKLEKQVTLFDNPETGLVYCDTGYIDEEGNLLPQQCADWKFHRGQVLEQIITENFVPNSGAVVRKHFFTDNKITFKTGIKGTEDWDIWIQLGAITSFDYVNEVLMIYRSHAAGTSKNIELMHNSTIRTMDNAKDLIINNCSLASKTKSDLLRICSHNQAKSTVHFGHYLMSLKRYTESMDKMKLAFTYHPFDIHVIWGMVKSIIFRLGRF